MGKNVSGGSSLVRNECVVDQLFDFFMLLCFEENRSLETPDGARLLSSLALAYIERPR